MRSSRRLGCRYFVLPISAAYCPVSSHPAGALTATRISAASPTPQLAPIVYEDDEVLGFQDIAPQAPVHVLFIPKQHAIPTLDDVPPEQALLVGKLALAAASYAREQGLAQDGYRIVMNCREHAGQTVFHIHLHLLAGAPLGRFGTP
ncbi:hypothetical protein LMG31884_33120 [Xanthomonas hydrangeae]|nr:hypothetical protein LMG31884_33120 [Xanthomonas hydrangeae]CAD7721482.1 hypothetical protein LMG31884_33120 [Xanthomonas hydrangeae]